MSAMGEGGSRAAKKRKKKQEGGRSATKLAKQSPEQGVSGKTTTPSSSSKVSSRLTFQEMEVEDREVELSGRSVLDILALEDPKEAKSDEKGALLLSALIEPAATLKSFYTDYWGKKPLQVQPTPSKTHLEGLLEKQSIRDIIDNQTLYLGQDVEMFRHDDGETLGLYPTIDKSGGAEISKGAMWKQHGTGGGILRLLQPQKYLDLLWNFQSSLEFEFGSRVGCHVELMPSSSVGYGKVLMDTTDSIVLQLEGVSKWKLFQPRKKQALKAQSTFVSSGAVSEDEALELSMPVDSFVTATVEEEPYSEVKLSPGDTLYIPRGWGFSYLRVSGGGVKSNSNGSGGKKGGGSSGSSSTSGGSLDDDEMHLRLFTHEDNSMKDLLERTLPAALATCHDETHSFRHSLPRDYSSFLGVASSELEGHSAREATLCALQAMIARIGQVAGSLIDTSADQLVKRFMGQRLPIPLSPEEEATSAAGASDARIMSYTKLRMLRPGIARAVIEDGVCVLYHCMDNSRELFGTPLRPLEFDLDDGVCIEALLAAYPDPIMVADLPHPSEEDEDKVGVALALYKEGFLAIDDDVTGGKNGGDGDGDGDGDDKGGHDDDGDDSDDPF